MLAAHHPLVAFEPGLTRRLNHSDCDSAFELISKNVSHPRGVCIIFSIIKAMGALLQCADYRTPYVFVPHSGLFVLVCA